MRLAVIITIATLIAMVAIGFIPANSSASQILPKHHIQDLPLKNQANWYRKNIQHAKTTLRWWKNTRPPVHNNRSFTTLKRRESRYHVRLLNNATRNYKQVTRRIARAAEKRRLYLQSIARPPHYLAWLCIHSYEGSWTDPDAPYYGGLQMDWSFMQSYGPTLLATKGTANNWTILEQMWVAERAYQSGRGFYPWPNTARMCGLI